MPFSGDPENRVKYPNVIPHSAQIQNKPTPNYLNFKNPKQSKPYYLKRLPFYKKYPVFSIWGGALVVVCIVYSAPLWYFLRTPVEDEPIRKRLFYGEWVAGKTYLQQFRDAMKRKEEERVKFEEQMNAWKEAREKLKNKDQKS